MKSSSKLIASLSIAFATAGCASAPPAPPTSSDRPAWEVATPPSAAVPNLTFLLQAQRAGTPLDHRATAALRTLMEQAGYRVVSDPTSSFDAELHLRAFVWGQELARDPAAANGLATTDHVRVTLAAIGFGRLVAVTRTYIDTKDGEVAPEQLSPALQTLTASSKLRDYSAMMERERQVELTRAEGWRADNAE